MATIKMDVSEYQAMKKVEALLEKSLEREKEQAEEIKELTKERVKVLEENDKSVTIIKTKRTSETKMSYYPQEEIIRRIQQYLNSQSGNHRDHHRSMHDDEMRRNSMMMGQGHLHSFFNSFFDTRTHEFETSKVVVRKGLDEVTATIREELKAELDQSTNDKFAHLKKLITEKTEWNRDLTKAVDYGKAKNTEANNLSKQLKILQEDFDKREEDILKLEKLTSSIHFTIAKQPTGLFIGSMGFKIRLLQLLKEEENESK